MRVFNNAGVKTYLKNARDLIKVCYLRTSIEYRLKRMIARMDDPKEIEKRIQNDDLIFNKELETLADWVIDSNDISPIRWSATNLGRKDCRACLSDS
mgnify:CR=1 FL=1